MSKPSFLAELKRRNVLRAAALYAGGAWLLVQVVTQVGPVFNLPSETQRWIIVAAAIGFPFAMALSWFYEWTPEGFKREDEVEVPETMRHSTGRKLDFAIIAVLSVAVVLLLADRFVLHRGSGGTAASADAEKSIAVLPLFNMGGDAKDAYLGDGISEEILTALSKLHGLKVIARASSFQFRDRDVDAAKVGRALNVHNLLTGTVQRVGENLRISVELVDTGSGAQVWAQHYDRDFKNLFELEDDISGSVSKELAIQLGAAAGQPLVRSGTSSAHAHDLYLQAKKLSYASDEASLNKAVELFNEAIAEDPNYAEAWAGMAYTYAFLADAYRAPIDVLAPMKGAAEKAIALDPNLAEAHAYLGYALLTYERDFPSAKRELDKAVALNPGSADAYFFRGLYPLVNRDPRAALVDLQTAEKLDPYNPYDPFASMWAASALPDQALTIRKAQQVLKVDPKFSYFSDPQVYAYGSFGLWKDCIDRYVAVEGGTENTPDYKASVCYAHSGNTTKARAILDRLEAAAKTHYVDHAIMAEARMALGDKDGAIAALEQAYKDRSQPLLLLWYIAEFKPLHDDPRYQSLIDRIYASTKPAATQ